MADLTTHLVTPSPCSNASLGSTATSIPIPPLSLWPIDTIPCVHVFPEELDLERLKEAVARAAGVWPTVAARYEKIEGPDGWEFSFRLAPAPIPLSTQTIHAASAFPTTHVVQPSVSPYLHPMPTSYVAPNTDSPLLALRLTTLLPSRQFVLGVNWAHILGDASACGHFVRILSHFYAKGPEAGLRESGELEPTFGPHVSIHSPTQEELERFQEDPLDSYPLEERQRLYGAAGQGTEMVILTLTREDVKGMRAEVAECLSERPEGSGRLSEQDVLSAWWSVVLERCGALEGGTVERMVYTISYRTLHPSHPSFPPTLHSYGGNAAQMLSFPVPSPTLSESRISRISSLALSIRSQLADLRSSPATTLSWLSCAAHRLTLACPKLEGQVVVPGPSALLVNSNLRFDWNTSFGFDKGRTAFHTPYSNPRVLRVHMANPKAGVDVGDIELSFNVKVGMTSAVEGAVEADRKRWKTGLT